MKVWTNERILLRLCTQHIQNWAGKLLNCEAEEYRQFGAKLSKLADMGAWLDAESVSKDTPPSEIP